MRRAATVLLVLVCTAGMLAQVNMPDPKQISGVPLPAPDAPKGSVSVRVIRGSFANNLADVSVTFIVDSKSSTRKTDESGRAQIDDLPAGARVQAKALVAGESLVTQETTVPATGGLRFVLAATDPSTLARAAEDKTLAAGPAVKGTVIVGSESRIVAEFAEDKLTIYYIFRLVNTARTPVDLGGPFVIDLPQGARSAGVMEDSTPNATVGGARVTVVGPFAPGVTNVNVGFELPYSGPTARLEQRWPAQVDQLSIFMVKTGGIDINSPQFSAKRSTTQQGQSIVMGGVSTLASGQTLALDISGLPYHRVWPRYVALGAASMIVLTGVVAAFVPTRRQLSSAA